jgi:hypothetical protein
MERHSLDAEKIGPSQHDETVAGDIPEKGDMDRMASSGKDTVARLDKAGLPLVPQPTSHRDDPLVRIRLLIDPRARRG